jgi:hypothetical protein
MKLGHFGIIDYELIPFYIIALLLSIREEKVDERDGDKNYFQKWRGNF